MDNNFRYDYQIAIGEPFQPIKSYFISLRSDDAMFRAVSSILPAAVGLIVLTGWTLDMPFLEKVGTPWVTMNPATAVGVILCSIALTILQSKHGRRLKGHARLFALLVLIIGLAKLSDLAFGTQWQIDIRLFARQVAAGGYKVMAPNAALAFVMLACGTLSATSHRRASIVASQILAVWCGFVAFLALVGYLYNTVAFYGVGTFTPMALHTAVCFILLSLGILKLNAGRGLLICITNIGPSGRMSRLLLPAAVIVPVTFGALNLVGMKANLYTPEFGSSLSVVLNVALLSILSWIGAKRLYVEDQRREAAEATRKFAEQALKSSEETLRLALRGIGVGVWDWDVKTNRIDWSDRFKELLGFSSDEMAGRYSEWETRLHPEDKSATVMQLQAHLNEHLPYDVDYRMLTKTGEWRWYHATGQAIWDQDDRPLRMAGSLDDVTDTKAQEQALRASEENFRSAIENASVGMALIDLNGQWITVNKSLCKLLGFSEEEILETDFQSRTHPDDLAESLKNAEELFTGHITSYEVEQRYFHKGGHIVWVLLNVSLALNPDGSPKHFVAQLHDITERKEMDRIKNEFISVVSHELRTPLTSIRGSLGLIAGVMSQELPENARGLIDIALKNSERLILLINDILDIDKIAAGQMRFNMKPEKLAPLMKQIVDVNDGYVQRYGIRIEQGEVSSCLTIKVDAGRFTQVLSNFIANAAKFSPKGGVVQISAIPLGGTIRISVTDNGPGIPEEFRSRIFTRFSQADSSSSRAREGTGLGLHISKEIVEHMGGVIGFDTRPAMGTSFWVEFPQAEP